MMTGLLNGTPASHLRDAVSTSTSMLMLDARLDVMHDVKLDVMLEYALQGCSFICMMPHHLTDALS